MKKLNIINITKLTLLSVTISIGTIFASEKFCDKRGQCYEYELEESEPHIHLISNYHDEIGNKLEKILYDAGFKKQIVYGAESLARTLSSENFIAKSKGYESRGYTFGLEGEMADTFMDFIYNNHFIYSYAIEMPELLLSHKERVDNLIDSILYNAHVKPIARKVILSFLASKEVDKINSSLISDVRKFSTKKLEDLHLIDTRAEELREKYSYAEWTKFIRILSLHMLDNYIVTLPKDEQPNIDKTRAAIENPEDIVSKLYIRFKLNGDWRQSFWEKNIDEIYKIAKKHKKPLFILIGKDHFETFEHHLKEKSYPIKSYPMEIPFEQKLAEKEARRLGIIEARNKDDL